MAKRYPGFHKYVGLNGCYRVEYDGDVPVVEVYLRSVPSFEADSGDGELILPDPTNRRYPDIVFVLDEDEDYWTVVSMEVPSFGMDGVSEFLTALLAQDADLTQPDELLTTLQQLLEERDAVWGELPVDIETRYDAAKLTGRWLHYHPGI
ncbi:hypothetical protein TcarDRAFT_2328 [Thermosinus carboxydivorans Nor1]|uniref:Uncharacterized protein n=1 Tax=Thermosinus carboxydivorans Nor1 TaxID=401526 RepID=A1HNL9_9FIRM|nr:hypothetical protein [Thermosinus carboxydivorans]EAX48378.1 hypothetical protein TcarDRAFT_2328 [Thermosinus carboxydivorans Nor1]